MLAVLPIATIQILSILQVIRNNPDPSLLSNCWLTAFGALAFGILLPAVFIFMRRVLQQSSNSTVTLAGTGIVILCSSCIFAFVALILDRSVFGLVILAITITIELMLAGSVVYFQSHKAKHSLIRSNGLLLSVWTVSLFGILNPYLAHRILSIDKILPQDQFWLWLSTCIAVPLVIGYLSGYRTPRRQMTELGEANYNSSQSGLASVAQARIEQLCAQKGLRVQPYMLGRMTELMNSTTVSCDNYSNSCVAPIDTNGNIEGALTWNVTSFFREPEALGTILPMLRSFGEHVKIKVIGTSTGEEAYSAFILASEAEVTEISVLATDISQDNLEWARNGIYHAQSLFLGRGLSRSNCKTLKGILEYSVLRGCTVRSEIAQKYFDPLGTEQIRMKPFVRNKVLFECLNILEDHDFKKVDLIFFRNVITHLTSAAALSAIRNIYERSDEHTLMLLAEADVRSLNSEVRESFARLFKPQQDGSDLPIFRKRQFPLK